MALRMKNFNISGGLLKNMTFKKGAHEKPRSTGGGCLKRGGLGLFADLREGLGDKEGRFFREGVETPMHTMYISAATPNIMPAA